MSNFDGYALNNPKDDRQALVQELEPDFKCPEAWGQGPAQNRFRHCTDTICYVLLVLTLLFMVATAIWAGVKSDRDGLYKLYDSSGNICGQGVAADYPNLFLQTFEAPYRSVCVKSCPRFDYNQIAYNSTVNATSDVSPMYYQEFARKYAGNSYTTANDMSENEAFAYNPGFANGYYTEQQWNTYVRRQVVECLPNRQIANCVSDGAHFFPYDSYSVLNKVCAPLSPKTALMFTKVSSSFQGSNVHDFAYAKSLYGYTALVAFGLSLVFLILLFLCTTLFSWVLFVSLGLALLAFGILLIVSYAYTGQLNDPNNALRVKYLQYLIDHRAGLLILAIFAILVGLFSFYLMIRYRSYIQSSIPLIKYATKSSLKNFMLNILSAVVLAVQIFVFVIELYIISRIYATGAETTNTANGQPWATYELNPWNTFCIVLHVFGTYWLIVTLNNFNDFICAAATVNDYFWHDVKGPIRDLNVFCHTLGHHVGSIAWCVFLLPAWAFKIWLGPIDWLTSSDNPNAIQRLVRKILYPCFWFYNRFIQRITANYFPITYLGCENFWPASKRYYYLTERYNDRAEITMLVGDFFSIASKLLIMIGCIGFAYLIYKSRLDYQQNINNIGLIFAIAALIGYIVGGLCINLFVTTYQAVVVCYLVEIDIITHANANLNLKHPPELAEVINEMKNIYSARANYRPLN